MSAVLALVYGVVSINNHLLLRTTGYDLGIFEQAVRAYAEGRAPVSELRGPGFVLLGDHFHPILATLAPVYRLFPSAVTLLVAQALLLAVSAIPVTRMAVRRFGTAFGACVGLAYGLSWGLLATVDFDFHEIVFAVPLLAFALERLVLERWTATVCWAAPLVLVKEEMPLTVAAIGAYLVLKGQRRLGAGVIAFGLVSFAVIVLAVIPAFAPDSTYGQGHNLGDGGPLQLLADAPARLVSPPVKLVTVLALLAPTAFLAVLSPLALLALPTLLWRFMSLNESHWGIEHHYSAILMPIAYIAFVHAMAAHAPRLRAEAVMRWRKAVAVVCALSAAFGLFTVLHGREWTGTERIDAARELMALIPDGATVAASNPLAPQLTATHTVQLFPSYQGNPVDAEWIIVDNWYNRWPSDPAQQELELLTLKATGYRVVRESHDYVLLQR
ncbi:DUF2079 domain-containing protein [Actinokineospora soli]|uniref:DUF2079 domain-containing protein n=1 Tax=Actinokineospora soli TaxID=1048753 RepID=A0ABW2TKI1_9PSEU